MISLLAKPVPGLRGTVIGKYRTPEAAEQALADFKKRDFWASRTVVIEEIVNTREAADEIERLTRELAEVKHRYAHFYDQQIGTPCAEIRWHQEREELTRELAEAREKMRQLENEVTDLRGFARAVRLVVNGPGGAEEPTQ